MHRRPGNAAPFRGFAPPLGEYIKRKYKDGKGPPTLLNGKNGDDEDSGWESPVEVFRLLRRRVIPLLRNGDIQAKNVVVDITGAKKSMVAGAFLFASFAGVRTSYVDFDRYDIGRQRPYGFSCRIGELESPATAFELDRWRRIETLYRQSAFGTMGEELEEAFSAMGKRKGRDNLFDSGEVEAVEKLRALAQVYAHWSDGDHAAAGHVWDEAVEKWTQLKQKESETLPLAVVKLRGIWPDVGKDVDFLKQSATLESGTAEQEDRGVNLKTSLFGRPTELLIYVLDELEKIRRLKDLAMDHRATLLRSAGLNEVLLKARIIKLWLNHRTELEIQEETVDPGDANKKKEFSDLNTNNMENHQQELEQRLSRLHGVSVMANFLYKRCWLKLDPNKHAVLRTVRIRRGNSVPAMSPYWENSTVHHPAHLSERRNKAIHFALPVFPEMAKKAFDHIDAGLKEFQRAWVDSGSKPESRFTPDWKKLCDLCGLDFLPPTEKDPSHG